MVKYKLVKNTNEKSDYVNMYSARATYDGIVDLDGLVKHMASHNSPFSEGTIAGVLKDMVNCIKELLLDSKKVKISDLAIFSLGLKSVYASSPKTFVISNFAPPKFRKVKPPAIGKVNPPIDWNVKLGIGKCTIKGKNSLSL